MKTAIILKSVICILFFFSNGPLTASSDPNIYFGKKKIAISSSEQDSDIYVDGKLMGKGSSNVIVPKGSCINVKVEKVGYLRYEIEFCNKKGVSSPPKSYYVKMQRDDAFDASVRTDIANVDIEITTTIDKSKAWRLLNQIILSYLDVVEITDKETGYLRTAWQVQNFKQNTIRTRIILKQSSEDPLAFKVKVVSEESRWPGTRSKSDELFREWDRVLRKYKDVISEAQSRLR